MAIFTLIRDDTGRKRVFLNSRYMKKRQEAWEAIVQEGYSEEKATNICKNGRFLRKPELVKIKATRRYAYITAGPADAPRETVKKTETIVIYPDMTRRRASLKERITGKVEM